MRMRKFKNIAYLFTLISLFGNCTSDNEEDLVGFCDTTNLKYSDLTYIFTNVCKACHSYELTYREGILFEDYQTTKASVNTGLVLPAIKHEGPYKMPFELPKLDDCDIDKIETWINNGMPEN